MCGIAGIHFFKAKETSLEKWQQETLVNELFKGIERRGRDATGIATIRGNGDIFIEKADVDATEFIKHRTSLDKRIKTILLHTRFATQGHQSNPLNNHPVEHNNAVIIHNGHIGNDSELFKEENLVRKAEVDSEVIAALFDKYGIEKAHIPLQKLSGGFAIAAIDQRRPTALVLAKGNSSPLAYFKNDNYIVWASESTALVEAHKAIGKELKYIDVDHAIGGDILFVEHGHVNDLKFQVKMSYSKPYRGKSYTSYGYPNSWDWLDEDDDKSDKKRGNGKEVIPHNGSYSIYPKGGGKPIVYRRCFECGLASNEDFLTKFDGSFYCDICLEGATTYVVGGVTYKMDPSSETEAEDKVLEQFDADEHMLIMDALARETGISAGMADYLLFNCQELLDRKITNIAIVDLYNELADLYDIKIGAVVGDEVEKAECEVKAKEKGTEIVLREDTTKV